MANNNVSTEALETVEAALTRYISEMNNHIQRMQDAARDCSDNMGQDTYSARAIEELQSSLRMMRNAMEDAEEIKVGIRIHRNTIEEV